MTSPALTTGHALGAEVEEIVAASGGSLRGPNGSGTTAAVIDAAARIARLAERPLVVVATPTLQALAKRLADEHGGRQRTITTPRGLQADAEMLDGAIVAVISDLPGLGTPTGTILSGAIDRAEGLVFLEGPRNADLFAARVARDQLARVIVAA